MKKHLKKLMLLTVFVGLATITNAAVFTFRCDDGRILNYISLEEEYTYEELNDVVDAYMVLCG